MGLDGSGVTMIAAFLQLQGALDAVDFDFAADALGALSPFKFDGLQAVLLDDVFGNTQPGVFHIHLDQDFAVALMIAPVDFDAAIHVRRFGDLCPCAFSSSLGSMPQTFSPQTRVTPLMAAPTAKCSQFLRAISVEPRAPVKIGDFHLDFDVPAVFGFGVDRGKDGGIRADRNAGRKPLGAQGIALNVQMRIVHGIVFVGTGRDLTERSRIDHFAAAEGGLEDFAVAAAAIDTARTEAAHGNHALGTVESQGCIIGVGR